MLAGAELRVGDRVIRRGRPPPASPKQAIKLRLDADVVSHFRSTGPSWQTRQALLPVVAATPGYTRLRYFTEWSEEGDPGVDRMPVVAWRIDEGVALLVTPNKDSEDSVNCVGSGVLLPGG
jgi:hypothetical protein